MRTVRVLSFAMTTAMAFAISGSGAACGGGVEPGGPSNPGAPSEGAGDGGRDPFATEVDPPVVPASKVDILFAVDNSASMQDKQNFLAKSVGKFLRRFAEPRCVDGKSGAVLGESVDGACATGVLEHAPIRDIHVGVISSSLGNAGAGDKDPTDFVCPPSGTRMNDRAHLLNTKKDGGIVANASQGFLAYAPGGGANTISDLATLEADAMELVAGVGQTGCGLEAQLESMYRFLIQPDPPSEVHLDARNRAIYSDGVDVELLGQRAKFLRPDSALAIVMLTDEDDSMVDPRSIGGQGWAFTARKFPGSKVFRQESASGTTAPRATSTCASDPSSADCTSCGFQSLCDSSDAACVRLKSDPACTVSPVSGSSGDGFDGYYGAMDDNLNVRFHRMKERYGIDPQFPIERYVRALTNRKVPSRETEHLPYLDSPEKYDAEHARYIHAPTCTNPIFAVRLPSNPGDEICNLPEGTRSRRLVSFTLIAGVPAELVPSARLSFNDWSPILGLNMEAPNGGIDPHMIQSVEPRVGLQPPSAVRGDNGSDPVHGREWATAKDDLQYACTFPLEAPVVCGGTVMSCECDNPAKNPPLCAADDPKKQLRGKAYPSIRPLRVAWELDDRALVGSICTKDPSKGYEPTLSALATHVGQVLVR